MTSLIELLFYLDIVLGVLMYLNIFSFLILNLAYVESPPILFFARFYYKILGNCPSF